MEETSECCANCTTTLKAPDPWGGGSPCRHTRNEKYENHSSFFDVNEHDIQRGKLLSFRFSQ